MREELKFIPEPLEKYASGLKPSELHFAVGCRLKVNTTKGSKTAIWGRTPKGQKYQKSNCVYDLKSFKRLYDHLKFVLCKKRLERHLIFAR